MNKTQIKVLLIEANPIDVVLLREALSQDTLNTFELLSVDRIRDAQIMLQENDVDIILLDLGLPDSQALDSLAQIHQTAPHTPKIILSGLTNETLALQAVHAGAQDYLVKSTAGFASAARAIRYAIERNQTQQELRTSEERFRSLFNNMINGLARCRMIYENNVAVDFVYLEVNSAFEDLTGLKDVVGKPASALIPGLRESNPQLFEIYDRVTRTGVPETFETYVPLLGESGIWFSVSVYSPEKEQFVAIFETITARKQAEERLRASEERFRAMIENGLDDISLLDMNGNLLWESPSTVRNLGYSEAAFIGRNIFEIIHPDDISWIDDLYAKLIQAPSDHQQGIFRLRHSNGSWRWVEAIGTNLLDNPSVQAIVVNYRDITDRRRIEESLRASETRYRLATLATRDVIWEWKPGTGHLTWAENAQSVLGYLPEEMGPSYKWWDEHIHPEDRERVISKLTKVINGNESIWLDEYRFLLKDATYACISDHGYIERDLSGKAIRVIGAMSNITENKRAEDALRESEALYRQAMEVAGAVPYRESYSDNGNSITYEFMGEGIRQITGYGPEEFSSQIWDTLTEEARLVEDLRGYTLDEGIQRVRSGENPIWKCEYRIRDRAGKTHWVFEAAVELRDENGVSHGSIGTFQDITLRKQAEDALRESEHRYRTLFDASPVAIWEEDFSDVKKYLDSLKQQGITDFKSYFESHPEVIEDCCHMIKVLNVNQTALQMYQADSKDQLIKAVTQNVSRGELEHNYADFVAIAQGQTSNRWEGGDETLLGKPIEVNLSWSVVPGYEHDFSKIIFITVDITERKRAERQLRESEARFASVFHTNPARVSITSFETGRFLDVNEAFLESTGYRREEVIGYTTLEMDNWVNPQDRIRLRDLLAEQGSVHNFETQLRQKSGWVMDMLLSAEMIELFGQRCILSVGLDITERKRSEQRVLEANERFRQLAENIQEVFWITDALTDNEIYISPAGEKIWGHSIDELMNTPNLFINTILPEDRPTVSQAIEKQRSGQRTEVEYRVAHPDGSTHWIWDRAFPIFDEAGHVVRLAGIAADITRRKLAEQALLESEVRFAGVVNSAMDAVISVDSEQRVVLFNPAAEQMFGCNAREALGQPVDRFIPERYRPQHQIFIRRFGQTGDTSRSMGHLSTLNGLRSDGTEFPIEASISHIATGDQHLYTVILRDITERKQAENALRARDTLLREAQKIARLGHYQFDLPTGVWESSDVLNDIFGIDSSHGKDMNSWAALVAPTQRDEMLAYFSVHVLEQHNAFDREYKIIRKRDGQERWVHGLGQLEFDSSGNPVRMIGTIQDITERKRAEEDIRKMVERQTIVYRTGQEINASLDTKQVFDALYRAVGQVMPCEDFVISLYDETRDVLGGEYILENNKMMEPEPNPADRGLGGHIVRSGQPVFLNSPEEIRASRIDFVPFGGGPVTSSVLAVPIRLKGKIIGILSAQSYQSGAYTGEDRALLEMLASYAASAIDNARLFGQAQKEIAERKQAEQETLRHLLELEALYENGLAVGSLLEPREIGARIINTFEHYLSWHHVTIRLLQSETNRLELIAFNVPNLSNEESKKQAEQNFNRHVQTVGQGLSGWVVQTGKPFRTGNVHEQTQYVYTYPNIHSGLYMPLKVGDTSIGVISVESDEPNAFTEQDERLLATLANQAAIALENARLYQSARQELQERKRMEAELRISETHYRELADSITDIFFELDHRLNYTHWNKASEALTGVSAGEAIGKSMAGIFGESDEQTRIERIYKDVLISRRSRTFETPFLVKSQVRSFEVNAYPSTQGVSVVAKDVTERKRTETIMQKRFELMEFADEASLEEIMQKAITEVCDLTGSQIGFFHFVESDQTTPGLQIWPAVTLGLFNVPISEGRHQSVDQAGVWADAIRQRRSIVHNEYESLPNKKPLPRGHAPIVREMIIPIIRNEKILAVIGVGNKSSNYAQQDLEIAERFADYAWDITERKKMEITLSEERNQLAQRVDERTVDLSRANANLARALRVKDEFLANMSHELRTPLNAILGLSESLAEQTAGLLNEKQQRYINTISESGYHLLSLINDILDLAKIEAGQITLDVNKVDIRTVCDASLRMIKQLAQQKNLETLLDLDDRLGVMWADERRLKQMLVNLLSNAVKFTPKSGKIGLEVIGDQEANRVTFTVWDTGIGIKDSDLPHLFQPFVQLDAGLARESSGTGLGLALVAQMARMHGGSASVVSEPGKGSRFSITLPWEPALAVDTVERLKSTGKFRPIKYNRDRPPTILLIEDTEEVIMMLADYLEMNGFKTITARDGLEGITQAQLTHPDLILMDVQMPRMDGFETTKKLRSDPDFKTTPIIALTALAMPDDRERCLAAGMDEYITKPVHLRALVKIIELFLSGEAKDIEP